MGLSYLKKVVETDTVKIKVDISKDLNDRLEGLKPLAEQKGFEFDLNAAMETAVKGIIKKTEKELNRA